VLKKYKFGIVLTIAILLNIFVFFWFLPNAQKKQVEEDNLVQSLQNIEEKLDEINAKVDYLQMQKAINDLLITLE